MIQGLVPSTIRNRENQISLPFRGPKLLITGFAIVLDFPPYNEHYGVSQTLASKNELVHYEVVIAKG